MPAFICVTCGTQYAETETPPGRCMICEDERQYVNPRGQAWTTMQALRQTHANAFRQHEPGLMGIGTTPHFAIGQRALLLRTPHGNILWDCISLLDEATIEIVAALGGISAIAPSHPHFYAAMTDWSHAFGRPPIHLHAADREFLARHDPAQSFWDGETLELLPNVTLVRCGGHFPGSSVLHWAGGAGGHGVLLTGDTLAVGPDRKLSFMKSYPNAIPLNAASVRGIANALQPWPFERIYGSGWDRTVPADGKEVLRVSAQRYVDAIGGDTMS